MLQHQMPRHDAVTILMESGRLQGGVREKGGAMGQRKAALDLMLADEPHRARAALEALLLAGDRGGTTLAAYIMCLSRTGDGFRARALLELLQRSNQASQGMSELLGAVAAQLDREPPPVCERPHHGHAASAF